MCSKCIFGILARHCGFCSGILDVYFPYLFKINQINLFDLNIELKIETGRGCSVKTQNKRQNIPKNSKHTHTHTHTHTQMEQLREKKLTI